MNCFRFAMCLLVTSLMAIVAAPANGVVIATEDFEDYGAGAQLHGLAGGSGFTGAWDINNAARRSQLTIINGGLNYAAGDIVLGGGNNAVQYLATEGGNTNDLASRPLNAAPDVVYFSVLYNRTNKVGNADFFEIGLTDSNVNQPLASGLESQVTGTFQVRSGNSGTVGGTVNSGVPSGLNTTSLLVVRAEKAGGSSTYNDVRLFVNPTSSDENLNAFTQSTANGGLTNATNFNFRRALHEVGDATVVDNIIIASTFGQAVGAEVTSFSVSANADADVQNGNEVNNNFGSSTQLRVKANSANNFSRKAYMRFDLADATGKSLDDASLKLTLVQSIGNNAGNLPYTFNVFGLNDGDAGENWDESTITWNNAPQNDINSAGGVLGNTTLLGQFDIIGGGSPGDMVNFSTAELISFLEADTNGLATFIVTRETIQPDGTNSVVQIFSSSEGAAGPQLSFELAAPVPEPATAVLGLMGLAGLVARRRRAA